MKVVVVGAGKVGETICQELYENTDIVLIDTNPRVIDNIFSMYDIQAVVGNGANVNVQNEAMVGESDIFLAVTNSDELNIVSCIIAKKLGAKYTIARVRNPEYHESVDFIMSSLGITGLINPEEESAAVLSEILKYPNSLSIESFANGKVNMVEVAIDEDNYLVDMTLKDFSSSFDGKLLVCIIERHDEVIIPTGNTVINSGDNIHVTGSMEDLHKFYNSLGKIDSQIKSTMIIGGGKLTYYLITKLLKRGMDIKLIEVNMERALEFANDFPEIIVINADGTDQEVLEEEGISEYDSCIALTGIDEENIMISLFAKYMNVKKCVAKVNRTSILKLLPQVGLDTIITPKRIIADKIVRFARSRLAAGESEMERLYKLADRKVEAMEFTAKENSEVIGIPLMDLNIKENTLVTIIHRNGDLIFPGGRDSVNVGDRVAIVTTQENIVTLDDIIKK